MAHKGGTAFIAGYGSVSDASADYDAVEAAHGSEGLGHLEAAVVSRDATGSLTIERHARLGGVHLVHSPTDDLKSLAQEVEQGSVALLVISGADDAKAVNTAATRATTRTSHEVEHFYLSNSDAGFYTAPPSDEVGGPAVAGYDGGVPDAEIIRPET